MENYHFDSLIWNLLYISSEVNLIKNKSNLDYKNIKDQICIRIYLLTGVNFKAGVISLKFSALSRYGTTEDRTSGCQLPYFRVKDCDRVIDLHSTTRL